MNTHFTLDSCDEDQLSVLPAITIRYFPPGDSNGITVEWRDPTPIDGVLAVLETLLLAKN